MSRSLKRLARRALIERQKDLYYHDLMQLRRAQQLEAIQRVQPEIPTPVILECQQHEKHYPVLDVVPEYVIVNEDNEMSPPGPSSRDWMLVVILVLGTAGMTLALCFLAFLVITVLMGGGIGSASIPLVQ